MKGKLSVTADRFQFIKEELGDKVEILQEYERDGTHFIQFSLVVDDVLDILFFFHAGVNCGCAEMQIN